MADLAELIIDVKQQQAIKNLSKVQKGLDSISTKAQTIGKTFIAGWTFTKLLNSINYFGRALSDVKVQARNFGTIFGSSLKQANEEVKNLVNNFDETERSAQKLLSNIGFRVFEAGFKNLDATKLTGQLATIAEEISAATGKNLTEISNKLSQGIVGQVGGLKDIGIVINTNSEAFKQQVEDLTKTNALTDQQAKKQAIVNQLLKQSTKYTGAFKQSADSVSHAFQNIANTFTSGIASETGKILNTVLTPILNVINKLLDTKIVKTFASWTLALGLILIPVKLIWSAFSKIISLIKKLVVQTAKHAGYQSQINESAKKTTQFLKIQVGYAEKFRDAMNEAKEAFNEYKAAKEAQQEAKETANMSNEANKAFAQSIQDEQALKAKYKNFKKDTDYFINLISILSDKLSYQLMASGNVIKQAVGVFLLNIKKIPLIGKALQVVSGGLAVLANSLKTLLMTYLIQPIMIGLVALASYLAMPVALVVGAIVAIGALITTLILAIFSPKTLRKIYQKIGNLIYSIFYSGMQKQIDEKVSKLQQNGNRLKEAKDSIVENQKRLAQIRQQQLLKSNDINAGIKKVLENTVKRISTVKQQLDEISKWLNENSYMRMSTNADQRSMYAEQLKKFTELTSLKAQLQDKEVEYNKQIYQKRKGVATQITDLVNWYNSQIETVTQFNITSKALQDLKLENVAKQMQNVQTIFEQFSKEKINPNDYKADDLIANRKQYIELIIKESSLRIDGLKKQFEAAKTFRNFIIDISKKLMQFKSSSVEAIDVQSTQGYQFANASQSQLVLPDSFKTNQADIKTINEKILKIQNDTRSKIGDIYSEIKKISEAANKGVLVPVSI